MPNSPLLLVDGSSYFYRAFHALPNLSNSKGQATGAIYGITNMLRRLLAEYQPTHAAVIFDAKGKTFRHELSADYKATRPPMPSELVSQIELTHEMVKALGFPLLVVEGVEADDVIGTLALQAEQQGRQVIIFTGDKDLAQLVNPNIILINTMNDSRLDEAGVQEKYGVKPNQIIDFLTLMGDKSDNVKGVDKVGEKTAAKWLQSYGSLEKLLKYHQEIKGKVGENLRQAMEYLPLSRQLVTIKCDVALTETPETLVLAAANQMQLKKLFAHLEFKQWLAELEHSAVLPAAKFEKKTAHYSTILSEEQFNNWIEKLEKATLFAFDTETTGLNYLTAELVGLSFAVLNEETIEAAYLPLQHNALDAPKQLNLDSVLKRLQPLLENPQKIKVAQNAKFDCHILANYNIQVCGVQFDTMLESYLLDSQAKHDLDSLAEQYLNYKTITFNEIAGKGAKQLTFNQVSVDIASQYAAEDADVTLQLHHCLWQQLQSPLNKGLRTVFETLEIPLIPVLVEIERNGVKIAIEQLRHFSQELMQRIDALEQQAYQLAGTKFNLNSPKQLQSILFEQLNLPVLEKTPTGQASTAESVLQELAQNYPLPAVIMEHRSLSKLKSTYVDALPAQIQAKTGRVHSSFHQAITVTGRLSSSDPNLQNIPIRSADGRKIRQAFIASENYKILSADYSQIELRIMAHLSGDESLLNAFSTNQDVHRATAAEVFNVTVAEVSNEQRRKAKAINFGLIYGMSAFGLAKQLTIEQQEAQSYIDTYFARYPKIKAYMENTRELAKQQGYIETVLGRRLYLPDIQARQYQKRQAAERTAINAPMQGTAADIIKKAMIDIHQWLKETQLDCKMILQVHDELVFEVANEIVETVKPKIQHLMSEAITLKVPLLVEVGVGDNWEAAH